eukprot:gene107-7550_t
MSDAEECASNGVPPFDDGGNGLRQLLEADGWVFVDKIVDLRFYEEERDEACRLGRLPLERRAVAAMMKTENAESHAWAKLRRVSRNENATVAYRDRERERHKEHHQRLDRYFDQQVFRGDFDLALSRMDGTLFCARDIPAGTVYGDVATYAADCLVGHVPQWSNGALRRARSVLMNARRPGRRDSRDGPLYCPLYVTGLTLYKAVTAEMAQRRAAGEWREEFDLNADRAAKAAAAQELELRAARKELAARDQDIERLRSAQHKEQLRRLYDEGQARLAGLRDEARAAPPSDVQLAEARFAAGARAAVRATAVERERAERRLARELAADALDSSGNEPVERSDAGDSSGPPSPGKRDNRRRRQRPAAPAAAPAAAAAPVPVPDAGEAVGKGSEAGDSGPQRRRRRRAAPAPACARPRAAAASAASTPDSDALSLRGRECAGNGICAGCGCCDPRFVALHGQTAKSHENLLLLPLLRGAARKRRRERAAAAPQDGDPPAAAMQDGDPPAAAPQDGDPPAAAIQDGDPPAAAMQDGDPPAAAMQDGDPPAAAMQDGDPPAAAPQHDDPPAAQFRNTTTTGGADRATCVHCGPRNVLVIDDTIAEHKTGDRAKRLLYLPHLPRCGKVPVRVKDCCDGEKL